MTILLVDDTREFLPGVRDDAVTVTNTVDALTFLETVTHVDELWLDFNLFGSDDAGQILFQLDWKAGQGRKVPSFGKVFLHSSSFHSDQLMTRLLHRLGVSDSQIERIWDQGNYFMKKVA